MGSKGEKLERYEKCSNVRHFRNHAPCRYVMASYIGDQKFIYCSAYWSDDYFFVFIMGKACLDKKNISDTGKAFYEYLADTYVFLSLYI